MLQKFQAAKRLIAICLVTLLLVTSVLTISPAPARADIVLFKCESDCDNIASFTAGAIGGSAVTLLATGNGGLAAAGITAGTAAIGQAATAAVVPLAAAAPAMAMAAPILAPVAATAAIGYGAYQVWDSYQKSQGQHSK